MTYPLKLISAVLLAAALALLTPELGSPGSEPARAQSSDGPTVSPAGGPTAAPVRGPTAWLVGQASVLGGPLIGTTVKLRRAKVGRRGSAVLAKTRSDSRGRFVFYSPSSMRSTDVLYLTARGGSRLTAGGARKKVPKQLELATLMGSERPKTVAVNERTTTASGFAAAQFLKRNKLKGKAPGLPNAAAMSHNLVNIKTGKIAPVLRRRPNGNQTSTKATLNSLSNAVSACAKNSAKCRNFLRSSNAGVGPKPTSSWQALAYTARYPSYQASKLFRLQKRTQVFTPALSSSPKAWTLALGFVGDRKQFDGPGNVAVDADGNVWANNNYTKSKNPKKICGSKNLFKLYPYRRGVPVASYSGGGLDGAGFGIGIDPKGRVWVGNFGFMGSKCTSPPRSNSVSEFRPNGKAISGRLGYTADLSWPQATVSDRKGNIWIASCKSGSVTKYPRGNPARSQVISSSVAEAFGIAFDQDGNAWATASASDKVFAFRQDGTQLPGSPYSHSSLDTPMGISADSRGNIWVADQGIAAPPCAAGQEMPVPRSGLQGKITKLDQDGNGQGFSGGGLTVPWGLAVDGNDNVWVANFQGQRLSHFCGTRTRKCPKGKKTGDGISPVSAGYGFDGLQRNTGIGIDGSGNVWLTNNWKQIPFRVNPGGNGLVAFIGLAGPVKTPSIGPPRRP